MTWDQRHWLEDSKTFPKCQRTCEKLKNWASYALWKLGNFWIFWKVNFDSNGPKLLMGLFFFHDSPFQAYARPRGPKGSIFSFFVYLFEFLFILIQLNQLNMWKISTLTKKIFLCMFCFQNLVHIPNMERIGLIDHNWYKMHMKKIKKKSLKSNIQKPLIHWIWSSFLNLIASLHNQEHKPNGIGQKAAQEKPL